ncbi:MAG TPA: ABC transporter permease, partial [Gemmatimonadaceae bacterium]|nr:ABC transporter permease [Gemmatimonadaceae bacterium]
LTDQGAAERVLAGVVTANLFPLLGVRPVFGRGFLPEEDAPGSANVAVLSHSLWTARFGADSGIVGRTITLSGERYEVIGVMPRGFRFADGIVYGPADLWLPMKGLPAAARASRGDHPGLVGIGLLRPGASVETARADLAAIAAELTREHPMTNADQSVRVDDAATVILGDLQSGLLLLLAAVALVLLVACANVAGLALARTTARGREIAIRVALGASHRHVALELLAESAIVSVAGCVGGLLVGWGALLAFGANITSLPRLDAIGLDARVFVLVAVASGLSTLLFATAPALWARRLDADRWLRTRSGTDVGATRARRAFVAAEVALTLMLLSVSGLLLRSFAALRADTGGIEPTGVLAFSVSLPADPYSDTLRATGFFSGLEARLRAVPGVEAVGAVSVLPFSGAGSQSGMSRFGEPTTPEYERSVDVMVATPDYFRTMGIALVRGRGFTTADRAGTDPVAIVDEAFAATFWPGEDPVGKRVQGWGFHALEVVGVVRHVTNYGVAAPSREELYVSHATRPYRLMTVVVRGQGDPAQLAAPARAAVRELDPNLPIYGVRAMRDVVDATLTGPRLAAFVSASFAAVALLLSAIGLYSLIAFQVAQRTREIGVRVALGAQRTAVAGMVVRQALAIVAAGCVLGAIGTVGAARLVRHQLFGVGPGDPLVLAAVAGLLLTVALIASAIPARRAASVEPLIAMRDE